MAKMVLPTELACQRAAEASIDGSPDPPFSTNDKISGLPTHPVACTSQATHCGSAPAAQRFGPCDPGRMQQRQMGLGALRSGCSGCHCSVPP